VADENAHIDLAVRNQAALEHLSKDAPAFCEWIVTVAFYKALHVVEAVFTHDGQVQHGRDHGHRHVVLKKTRRYQKIWTHYRPLWVTSTIARYLKQHDSGEEYNSFADYLSPERVLSDMVDHHLHQVQRAAVKFLTPASGERLTSPAPPAPKERGAKPSPPQA